MSTEAPLAALPLTIHAAPSADRRRLIARARLLAWVGLGWHVVEAGAGVVVIWPMADARSASPQPSGALSS